MKVSATNKSTGEVIELSVNDLSEIMSAWMVMQQYEKLATDLRNQLKDLVRNSVNDSGVSEELDNRIFKVNSIQRTKYNTQKVREALGDEDLFNTFVEVNSTELNKWLKNEVKKQTLDFDVSRAIKEAKEPAGNPYEVIKLETLS